MSLSKTYFRLHLLVLSMLCGQLFGQAPALRPPGLLPRLTLRITPREGAVLQNNVPTLAWSSPPAPARETEVWIDGLRMASLPGDRTQFSPFPLSFGRHRWHVVFVRPEGRETTPDAHFTIQDGPLGDMPEGALLLREGWWVRSSEEVGMDGARLSAPESTAPEAPTPGGSPTPGVSPAPSVFMNGWARTSVPATALTALARNGIYPNPYLGLNNERIPDACDLYNERHGLLKFSHLPGKNPWKRPYWFRTTFRIPNSYAGKRIWMNFGEINYRAEVWLNGKRIADARSMVGMERSFRFEITPLALPLEDNVLAVAIHPVDAPGRPADPPLTPLAAPGSNMGDTPDISRSYTKWDTMGWDWQPEIHDRDMGITEDVFLSATDDVEIVDPYVGSKLPLPRTDRAELSIAFDLVSHGATARQGLIQAVITDEDGRAIRIEEPFSLPAGTTRHITWTAENRPELRIQNPRLWWPSGFGAPHLYTLRLELIADSGERDTQTIPFGIRTFETFLQPGTGIRAFRVNGRDLHVQGGNWVIDMMLNWNASRFDREIEIAKASNLNCLRVWGPTGAPPSAFYRAADRAGILIWQDFLNDFWGTLKNAPGNTPDEALFEQASAAIIRRARNHPSLFLWCGGNEGPNPHEELLTRKLLPELDPWGSHYYLKASNGDGLQGGGPYNNLPPEEYFDHPKLRGFNSEIGPSGVPEWDSVQAFMDLPPTGWARNRFPLDGQWAYHDANDWARWDSRKFSSYDTILRCSFGEPSGQDENGVHNYIRKCQMVNFDAYRAALESNNVEFQTRSTGFALWKFNASWPSMTWQITDWFMRFNAGFYAVRRALEPIHIQFNSNDRTLLVLNRTAEARAGLKLEAEVFDTDLKRIWNHQETLDAAAYAARKTSWTVPVPPRLAFLKLRILDAQGQALSDNTYWMERKQDFRALSQLGKATLTAEPRRLPDGRLRVSLRNDGPVPALLARVRLLDGDTRVEPLPAIWSDNYVNLLPGERADIALNLPEREWPESPVIEIDGYNIEVRTVAVQPSK